MNNPTPASKGDDGNKELAALSYIWIFSLFILLAKRDDEFIQHHARRGFVLFLLSLLLWVFPFLRYGEFAVLILMILGFISAAQGNLNTMPILSEFADGTLKIRHFKRYWHYAKHGIINIIKPSHSTPVFRIELENEAKEFTEREKKMAEEKKLFDMEEKKLSALYNRVSQDEKRLDELASEVHDLEKQMDELKK